MSSRILVIEDDAVLAHLEQSLLERAGYQVDHVTCINAAYQALSQLDVDLIVLDVFLPDGDGLQACQHIREHYRVPVLMQSSVIDQELGEGVVGPDWGPQAFIEKPVDPTQFLATVARLLADG
ncbi:MAG: response regulator [Fimbriimonadaceae bacterium]|nr:response regulator [Fimbriimonadaceae bacterium]